MNARTALFLTWFALASAAVGYAIAASSRGPDSLPGCIYNATPPTLTDGQSAVLQCDVNGKLKVNTT
jgi:hypothetical protein